MASTTQLGVSIVAQDATDSLGPTLQRSFQKEGTSAALTQVYRTVISDSEDGITIDDSDGYGTVLVVNNSDTYSVQLAVVLNNYDTGLTESITTILGPRAIFAIPSTPLPGNVTVGPLATATVTAGNVTYTSTDETNTATIDFVKA